ncbi:MAG: hypothetical protein LBG27_08610 [Spirochaetaceae bacterium]|jgi:hypothetical protein|nr:hypothetical protein [Spirochaetaceae bacterium]
MKRAQRVIWITAAVLFTSCVGVKTEITVGRDLSGTARLEYTVSRSLLDSGTLDGNENWPTIPVGKADFERTVSRIEGLTLRSYRERDQGGDRIFEVTLAFDHVSALTGFLSANGQQFAYTNEDGRHVFTTRFNRAASDAASSETSFDKAAQAYGGDLSDLVKQAFEGYRFDFTISVPGDKKTYSAPMGDLLTTSRQESMEISF